MDFQKVKTLNERLKKTYGTYTDGRALFRLSWSNSQRETRWGSFSEFCGPIFLRSYDGIAKDRPKYPMFQNRWILEKLMFPANAYRYWTPEIIGVENGSYEPVWTFEKNGKYQEPEWYPITKLVKVALWGPEEVMTASDAEREDALAFEKDVQESFEILDNENPAIANAVHHGEGIFVP